MEPSWEKGTLSYKNGPYDQDGRHAHVLFKTFFSGTQSSIILKLGMQHWELKLYKVYINNDPGLSLAYYMARSNLVAKPY